MKHKIKNFVFICLIFMLLMGCSQDTENNTSTEPSESDQIIIYTTLYPIVDFTSKIGGEEVIVKNILPPGTDEHTYEPSTDVMINIAKADYFFYNGVGMEGYIDSIIKSLKEEKVKMIDVTDGLELTNDHNTDEEHHAHIEEHDQHIHSQQDPHVWIDPNFAIKISENIYQALIDAKPAAKEQFKENLNTLKNDLEELDEEFKQLVAQKSSHKILVSHAAFGYWESRYGIEQIAVSGLSTTNEPSQKQIEDIINTARENNLKYIIFEQNVTPKIAKVVQTEIKAEPLYLHNLAVLTEEDIKNKEDYFSLMKKNIATLDKALR